MLAVFIATRGAFVLYCITIFVYFELPRYSRAAAVGRAHGGLET